MVIRVPSSSMNDNGHNLHSHLHSQSLTWILYTDPDPLTFTKNLRIFLTQGEYINSFHNISFASPRVHPRQSAFLSCKSPQYLQHLNFNIFAVCKSTFSR